ncbi:MAG: hypothetical protein KAJ73_03830, partial [Zetaproteobacteria bacterium]|nr:hypothetical protein [Zetaproteobacteria bacterium]
AMTNQAGFRLTVSGRVRNDTALSPLLPCSDAPMRFVLRHPACHAFGVISPFRSEGTAFPSLPQIVRCDDFIV